MKLSSQALKTLGAKAGAGSVVTAGEFKDSQITVVKDEGEVFFSVIGRSGVHRGNVRGGGKKALQEAILYHGSTELGIIQPHIVFPKEERDELRLYISAKAFDPPAGSIWYVFTRVKDNRLCLGWTSQPEFDALQNGELNPTRAIPPDQSDTDESHDLSDLAERIERSILIRRGQAQFRRKVRIQFGDTCCVTGSTLVDVLEAAHIELVSGSDINDVTNGLLLRSDIHTLFDLGLVAIHPEDLRIHLRPDLKGTEYEAYQGQQLLVSDVVARRINKSGLRVRWQLLPWTSNLKIDPFTQ